MDKPKLRTGMTRGWTAIACAVFLPALLFTGAMAETGAHRNGAVITSAAEVDDVTHPPRATPRSDSSGQVTSNSPANTDKETTSPISLVSSAELLRIRFQGNPNLSGEYLVGGDETISIPVIGRHSVNAMTLADLEALLSEEVIRSTGRQAYVTVDVAKYRDVYVVGFVKNAGAYPWGRGMSVLHAETLAGGAFRPTSASGSTLVTNEERNRARQLAAELGRNLITLERLKVESLGKHTMQRSEEAKELLPAAQADAIFEAQQALLESRIAAFEVQTSSLSRVINVARTELEAVEKQRSIITGAVLKRGPRFAKLKTLQKRGIVTEDRLLSEEIRVMELNERLAGTSVSIARLKSTFIVAERELEALERERKARLQLETQQLEREITQLRIKLEGAESLYRSLTGKNVLSSSGRGQEDAEVLTYDIVRIMNEKSRTISADQSTLVFPGDIIKVNLKSGG